MKISLTSDIHNEFDEWMPWNPHDSDVLILSGDIIESRKIDKIDFIENCSKEYNHVIYVAGNHEFYGSYIKKTLSKISDFCGQFKNVHFLENGFVDIEDVRFIGATLWTDLNKADHLTELYLKQAMNDYHKITYDIGGYRKLLPSDTFKFHKRSVAYIENAVTNTPSDKKVVVCTHHAPTFQSVPEEFKKDHLMNGGYCSDLSELILNLDRIKVWTHGHTHNSMDYLVGNTRVVCNPRGYVGFERGTDKEDPYYPLEILV